MRKIMGFLLMTQDRRIQDRLVTQVTQTGHPGKMAQHL